MTTLGICFSNIHDHNIPELTKLRTIASVPFGGRYRLIDFAISGMVNAGIQNIGIITRTKYRSLMSYIGSGKDWDLNRNNGGITFLAPYFEAESGPLYSNRLEALFNSQKFIEQSNADYVLLSDCDLVATFPFKEAIEFHEKNNTDVTVIYTKHNFDYHINRYSHVIEEDEDHNVTGIRVTNELYGDLNFGMNAWILKRSVLLQMLREANELNMKSFSKELIPLYMGGRINFKAYEYKGFIAGIDSLYGYYRTNMWLLNKENRHKLFDAPDKPVITRVRGSAPTKYGKNAKVVNSIICDGCNIKGTVINSIISRGVTVGENAVVKNSILLKKTIVAPKADIDYVITEKRALITKGRVLKGCDTHPFFIGYGEQV
ncbi:MAG: glucose-1-phosphate adenylyltransferase subunit GlgD [Eubacterium sp.]|nr:glucose-1-phosphate adenylyltransferase subunit GlgD [Eubacterium sp.]